MAEGTEKSLARKWLDKLLNDAILLAFIPVVAYLISFAYESGYAEHFGIPFDFVAFGFSDFYRIFVRIASTIWFIYIYLALLIMVTQRWKYQYQLLNMLPTLGLFLAPIFIWGFADWEHIQVQMYIILGLVVLTLILWGIYRWMKKSGKLDTPVEQKPPKPLPEKSIDDLHTHIQKRFGIHPYYAYILITMMYGAVHSLGQADAEKQTEFISPMRYSSAVILRNYSDRLIIGHVDSLDRVICGHYDIYWFKPGDTIGLRNITLHPGIKRK